mgnify:CR=1 FL=1
MRTPDLIRFARDAASGSPLRTFLLVLAMAITALALQYYVGRDVVQAVRPGLTATPRGLAATTSRLVDFAQFMVDGERQRRATARAAASAKKTSSSRTPE